jgi:hypothetical protein
MRPMKKPFKTIALIGKYKSPEIAKPLLELGAFLEKRGMNVLLDRLTASRSRISALAPISRSCSGATGRCSTSRARSRRSTWHSWA